MRLEDARKLLPTIRQVHGFASTEFSDHYDVEAGQAQVCINEPLTGKVTPIAIILKDCGYDDRLYLTKVPVYIDALLTIIDAAFDVIKRNQPPKPKPRPTNFAQACGRWCNDARFRRFLIEMHGMADPADAERVKSFIHRMLRVQSRAELDTDHTAAQRWQKLFTEYQVWSRT